MANSPITFIEDDKSQAKIKVIGVGGGGGNAVNAMLDVAEVGEVALYAINTDVQALDLIGDGCERIQIGNTTTKGLGVGANPKLAAEAAAQDIDRVVDIVEGADMVFIAAGMGGGTGTGAAPVIGAKCRELGILTVAIVTRPFKWENRAKAATEGIGQLSKCVDSIIVVPNDRICEVFGDDMSLSDSFAESDRVLSNAVAGICEIIYSKGKVNVDFADVRTVMAEMGQAMMGTASATGADRARVAAENVIACPLLEGIKLENAQGLLVNITADEDSFKHSELNAVMDAIQAAGSPEAKVFFGFVDNKEMGEELRITLVATGLSSKMEGIQVFSGGRAAPPGAGPSGNSPVLLRPNRGGAPLNAKQSSLLDDDGSQLPAMLRRQHN